MKGCFSEGLDSAVTSPVWASAATVTHRKDTTRAAMAAYETRLKILILEPPLVICSKTKHHKLHHFITSIFLV